MCTTPGWVVDVVSTVFLSWLAVTSVLVLVAPPLSLWGPWGPDLYTFWACWLLTTTPELVYTFGGGGLGLGGGGDGQMTVPGGQAWLVM